MRALLIPKNRPPTSSGEMLVEEFLKPLGISQTEFAKAIGITYHRLNEIVNGRRGITIDTALRFSRALGTTPDFWLNLQRMTDLNEAMRSPQASDIARIKPLKGLKSSRRTASGPARVASKANAGRVILGFWNRLDWRMPVYPRTRMAFDNLCVA